MSRKKRTAKPGKVKNNALPELREYVKSLKQHKKELYVFIVFYLLFAVVFKYFYPYTDVTPDTGGYINWIPDDRVYGGPRPLGYSYFLAFARSVAIGSGTVFMLQYILYCVAVFFFYSTTVYIFRIQNKYIRYAYLLISLLFIPGLYTTNMVMSDNLFASLTLLLVTFCLWLLYKPAKYMLIPVVVILPCLIMIRYIGMIYPAIVIPVLFLSFKKKIVPAFASLLIILLVFGMVQKVKKGTKEEQGVEVFSAFAGWQSANNALHVIPHLDLSRSAIGKTEDRALRQIDTVVRGTYPYNEHLYPDDNSVSYLFIWLDSLPLRQAFRVYRNNNYDKGYYRNWNQVGAKFSEYAGLLIKEHFWEYFRYYLVNNTARVFDPPLDELKSFGNTSNSKLIPTFFSWKKSENIQPRQDFFRPLLKAAPFMFFLYWLFFFATVVYLVIQVVRHKQLIRSVAFKSAMFLAVFVLFYCAANVYGAPVVLRMLMPVRMLLVGTVIFAIQFYIRRRQEASAETRKQSVEYSVNNVKTAI